MVIEGSWNQNLRPYIYGRLEFPIFQQDQQSVSRNIEFLIDTGSPFSFLSQSDAATLGLHELIAHSPNLIKDQRPISMMGDTFECYGIPDVLFYPMKADEVHTISKLFTPPSSVMINRLINVPSILGMDFISQFNMVFHKDTGKIILTSGEVQYG